MIACVAILLFATVFWISPERENCELAIEEYVFLTKDEEMIIKNFNPKLWEINITKKGIVEVEGSKIKAVGKGETHIRFGKRGDENCFFDVKIAVANVDSGSISEKLKEELAIDLKNTQIDGSIPLLPPLEATSR